MKLQIAHSSKAQQRQPLRLLVLVLVLFVVVIIYLPSAMADIFALPPTLMLWSVIHDLSP